MRLFKRLFAGPEDASKVIDAGIKGIDAAWFTNEEKAEFTLKYMLATQSQNVARRLIAFLVIAVFLFLIVLAGLMWPLLPEWSEFLMTEVVDVKLSSIVGIIIGFYFLTHATRALNLNGKK